MATRLEKFEESAVRRATKTWYWKFVSPGHAGVPDRIIFPHGAPPMFQEAKRNGAKPRPAQAARMVEMRKHGIPVCWSDSAEGMLEQIETWVTICNETGLTELYRDAVMQFHKQTGPIRRKNDTHYRRNIFLGR